MSEYEHNEHLLDEIQRLRESNFHLRKDCEEQKQRIKRLEEWKESALEVEREWDANAIATLLGAKLGESQRKVIQREVPKLLIRIKRLEEAVESIREYWNRYNNERAMEDACWNAIHTASKARKAKEAKL